MAEIYFYKCNPKVAAALSLTSRDRFTFRNGAILLWAPDLKRLDRDAYLRRRAELLARIGAVELTDPQATAEQQSQSIVLPIATDPDFYWKPEGAEEMESEETEWETSETEEVMIDAEEIGAIEDLLSDIADDTQRQTDARLDDTGGGEDASAPLLDSSDSDEEGGEE